ncbi:MAG TPA: hypothetical protein VFP72_21060, partial [Kineosporiaceae bacterium]|nr:hypothetical protein [Kineosporiaceae bacterium]
RASVARSRRAEQAKARRRHRRRSWQQEMGAQAWQRAVAGSALMAVSGALGLAAMQHSVPLPSWNSEARPPGGATAAQPLFAPLAVVAEQPQGNDPLDVPLSESAAGRIAGAGTFFADGSFLGTGSAGRHAITPQVQAAKDYARSRMASFGWSDPNEQVSLDRLWTRESGWQVDATNPTSGAYGIPQSLPASKLATAGADWRTNYRTQIDWGLNYIKDRYGSPAKAWAHSQATGWY